MQTNSKELRKLLLSDTSPDDFSGFLPDKATWDADLVNEIATIQDSLGVNLEAFNAQAAARGSFRGGEATERSYRDVVAPLQNAAASAVSRSRLGYAQAYQQGMVSRANIMEQRSNRLLNMYLGELNVESQPSEWMQLAGTAVGTASMLPFVL